MPKTYSVYAAKWHLSLAKKTFHNGVHSSLASLTSSFFAVLLSFLSITINAVCVTSANTKVTKSQRGKPITAITTCGNYKGCKGPGSSPTNCRLADFSVHASEQQSLISWPQNEWRRTKDRPLTKPQKPRPRVRAK